MMSTHQRQGRSRPLSIGELRAWRRAVVSGSPGSLELLLEAGQRPLRSAGAIRELHELLLFAEAYPSSPAHYAVARRGLERIVALVRAEAPGSALRKGLQDSGLEGCETISVYSLTLVRWLLQEWPGCTALYSIDAPLEEAAALLRPLLPEVLREAADLPCEDTADYVSALFGADPLGQLSALVGLFPDDPVADAMNEAVFARLQVYVRIHGRAKGLSLTRQRAPAGAPFVHPDGLLRSIDRAAIMAQPIGSPLRLGEGGQHSLIHAARAVLCVQHRETDPVSYARSVECFDLGRGLRVALFHMDAAHRLALESYVGFMAFKNGVPLAYGGAWVFPGRTRVGINVFPAMRGGESAMFFAQLLRLYHQRFGVTLFEAENYQLGHGNADGLRSGAYWFYYRLGFRPWNQRLAAMAEEEFSRLTGRKGYTVPLRTLKELVADGLVLRLPGAEQQAVDTVDLLRCIRRTVAERHGGDAARAMRQAVARLTKALPFGDLMRWTAAERVACQLWALPLDLIPDLERWTISQRRQLVAIIRAKGAATETRHQRLLARAQKLLAALRESAGAS